VRKRLADGRRDELLDGVMRIIAAEGFSGLRVADLAPRLHCSVSTLYKIAPNKDSLIALAITRWGEAILEDIALRADQGVTATDRARLYWRAAAEHITTHSQAFRADLGRFESARLAYRIISQRFIDRFVELLDDAVEAGEIEATNTCFLAHIFRQIALIVRDQEVLDLCGLNAAEAMLEVERIFWTGIGSARFGSISADAKSAGTKPLGQGGVEGR
jgi:AcrR family transcriptional regulator